MLSTEQELEIYNIYCRTLIKILNIKCTNYQKSWFAHYEFTAMQRYWQCSRWKLQWLADLSAIHMPEGFWHREWTIWGYTDSNFAIKHDDWMSVVGIQVFLNWSQVMTKVLPRNLWYYLWQKWKHMLPHHTRGSFQKTMYNLMVMKI